MCSTGVFCTCCHQHSMLCRWRCRSHGQGVRSVSVQKNVVSHQEIHSWVCSYVGYQAKGPKRPQPLVPFCKFMGMAGAVQPWEGPPVLIDGSHGYRSALHADSSTSSSPPLRIIFALLLTPCSVPITQFLMKLYCSTKLHALCFPYDITILQWHAPFLCSHCGTVAK